MEFFVEIDADAPRDIEEPVKERIETGLLEHDIYVYNWLTWQQGGNSSRSCLRILATASAGAFSQDTKRVHEFINTVITQHICTKRVLTKWRRIDKWDHKHTSPHHKIATPGEQRERMINCLQGIY